MSWKKVNKSRLILLLTLCFTVLGAAVFRTPPILFMAATLFGAPLIAWIVGRVCARGLRVARKLPESASVGERVKFQISLHNEGRLPAFLVGVFGAFARGAAPSEYGEDSFELSAPAFSIDSASDSAARAEKNVPFLRFVGEPNLLLPIILPRGRAVGVLEAQCLRRGAFEIAGAVAVSHDPIGLFAAFSAPSRAASLLILPPVLPLARLEVGGSGQGAQKPASAAAVAEAADLHGVRPHRAGEGVRRVHWKATARTGVLHVVEWEEETASDLVILLDVQAQFIAGDAFQNTLESAILAAASASAYCLENAQRVRIFWLETSGGQVKLRQTSARHRGALREILAALAKISPCADSGATLAFLCESARAQCPDFEAFLVLSSDGADIETARKAWPAIRDGKTLLFHRASFSDKSAKLEEHSEKKSPVRDGAPATSSPPRFSNQPVERNCLRVRRGESLTAALQKPL